MRIEKAIFDRDASHAIHGIVQRELAEQPAGF